MHIQSASEYCRNCVKHLSSMGRLRSLLRLNSMATECLACRYLGVSANVRPVSDAPLVSTNHDGYVLLQLGSNVLALYQRPTKQASEVKMSVDWVRWARPLMLLGMLALGSLHFVRAKAGLGRRAPGLGTAEHADAVLRAKGYGGYANYRGQPSGAAGLAGLSRDLRRPDRGPMRRGVASRGAAISAIGDLADDEYDPEPLDVY